MLFRSSLTTFREQRKTDIRFCSWRLWWEISVATDDHIPCWAKSDCEKSRRALRHSVCWSRFKVRQTPNILAFIQRVQFVRHFLGDMHKWFQARSVVVNISNSFQTRLISSSHLWIRQCCATRRRWATAGTRFLACSLQRLDKWKIHLKCPFGKWRSLDDVN